MKTRGGWRRPQEEFEANTKLDMGFDEPSMYFQKRMQSDPNSTCICAGLLLSNCTRKEGVVGDQALSIDGCCVFQVQVIGQIKESQYPTGTMPW